LKEEGPESVCCKGFILDQIKSYSVFYRNQMQLIKQN